MATVTITIKDTSAETANVEVTFDPPIQNEHDMTAAQQAALAALEGISSVMPTDNHK